MSYLLVFAAGQLSVLAVLWLFHRLAEMDAAYERAHHAAMEGPDAPDTGRDRSKGAPDRELAAFGPSPGRN